jgi:hypothetical protein
MNVLRKMLIPTSAQILVDIPNNFIHHQVELIMFPVEEKKSWQSQSHSTQDLMSSLFNGAKKRPISSAIDIHEMMNETNYALP